MKVGFCGSGAWGITLANLLAENGHDVLLWSIETDVIKALQATQKHPKFSGVFVHPRIKYTASMEEFFDRDVIVECVTAKGFRPVLTQLKKTGFADIPLIITSKGIEQDTHALLVEVAKEIWSTEKIGYLSGPTLAKEVQQKQMTSAIAASTEESVMQMIQDLFQTSYFRVLKNSDIFGVALGGAMKNVIAMVSGIAEGLGHSGYNTKALLITRGLFEMTQLAEVKGASKDTCFGLSGIGDLIVTGVSPLSRNFSFGKLLGQGHSVDSAREEIGMVIEGAYTVVSVYQLLKEHNLNLPITEALYQIIYENVDTEKAFFGIFEQKVDFEWPAVFR